MTFSLRPYAISGAMDRVSGAAPGMQELFFRSFFCLVLGMLVKKRKTDFTEKMCRDIGIDVRSRGG